MTSGCTTSRYLVSSPAVSDVLSGATAAPARSAPNMAVRWAPDPPRPKATTAPGLTPASRRRAAKPVAASHTSPEL